MAFYIFSLLVIGEFPGNFLHALSLAPFHRQLIRWSEIPGDLPGG